MIKRQKNTYIILSIIFVVFALVFAFSAFSETTKYQDMDAKVKTKQAELGAINDRANYLKIISVNSEKMAQNLAMLSNCIGKSIAFGVVANDIKKTINGLCKVKSIVPQPMLDKGIYKELTVEVEVETDFDSLRRLVYTIKYPAGTANRCFRLDSLKYTMDSAGKVTASLIMAAFTYN